MAKEKESVRDSAECCKPGKNYHGGMGGGVYGLAFVGAAIYFIQHADTFWTGVLGFLKAIVWPAILMYKVLTMLNM